PIVLADDDDRYRRRPFADRGHQARQLGSAGGTEHDHVGPFPVEERCGVAHPRGRAPEGGGGGAQRLAPRRRRGFVVEEQHPHRPDDLPERAPATLATCRGGDNDCDRNTRAARSHGYVSGGAISTRTTPPSTMSPGVAATTATVPATSARSVVSI